MFIVGEYATTLSDVDEHIVPYLNNKLTFLSFPDSILNQL